MTTKTLCCAPDMCPICTDEGGHEPTDFSSFVTDSAGFRIPLRSSITPGDRHVGGIDRLGVRFYRERGDDVCEGPRYAVVVTS